MSNSISDTIINFINGIQSLNFDTVLLFFIGYIGFMWLVASFWVYLDARKRYAKWWVVALISIFVFVCNLPALILYVMMRPEYTKDEINMLHDGIVNVFIKQGKLLAAPTAITNDQLNVTSNTSDMSSMIEDDVEITAIKNSDIRTENKVVMEQNFQKSIVENFRVMGLTLGRNISNIKSGISNSINSVKNIRVEFYSTSENTKPSAFSQKEQSSGSRNQKLRKNIEKNQNKNNSYFNKKSRSHNNLKLDKKSRTSQNSISNSQDDLEFKIPRKKIPPVKFIMK